jgi:hypothetical protein
MNDVAIGKTGPGLWKTEDKSGPYTGSWHFADPFKCWCPDMPHSVDEAVVLNEIKVP